MHYIDIDWVPSAITIALAVLVVVTLRFVAWLGATRAQARTRRAIEHVLSEADGDESRAKRG